MNRHCLGCGILTDDQTGPTGDKFSDGDCSICLYCGKVAVFQGDGYREPTPAEEHMFLSDPQVILLQEVAKSVSRRLMAGRN